MAALPAASRAAQQRRRRRRRRNRLGGWLARRRWRQNSFGNALSSGALARRAAANSSVCIWLAAGWRRRRRQQQQPPPAARAEQSAPPPPVPGPNELERGSESARTAARSHRSELISRSSCRSIDVSHARALLALARPSVRACRAAAPQPGRPEVGFSAGKAASEALWSSAAARPSARLSLAISKLEC